MLRVNVVVINFRQPELTLGCLESLEPEVAGRDDVRVSLVDNDSGDGSADRLERELAGRGWDAWTDLVRSPRNGGFSWGNNRGIEHADAAWHLLLNSDARLRPGCLDGLLAAGEADPRIGLVGPRLEWPDGEPQVSCFRFRGLVNEALGQACTGVLDRLLGRFVVPMGLPDGPTDADWVSFACVLVRRAVFEQVGLMDEGYFLYFEDIDFARSARRAGWRVVHDPRPRAIHLRGGSSSVKKDMAARTAPPGFYYESRSRYFGKWYGGAAGVVAANLAWTAGRTIGALRSLLDRRHRGIAGEGRRIWTRWRRPMDPPSWPRG